ncbi:MAG: gamma-glutamyltransferase family protein [Phycisphaerales bacterium]|nr:gamma-glutamyltransferase family protein [Phycisphaerales bacterium]
MMSDFDWRFPYPSQRMPVLARNIVATSQPLAAQAGLDILRAGGNAVDAAIATAITLTVVEPTSNGLGADNFALIWSDGRLHGLNASGRAPAALRPEDFGALTEVPLFDWRAVTVPGAVSGWVAAHQRFGRLPFASLFEAAIRYAKSGFLVSPQTAYYWGRGAERYEGDDFRAWHDTFAPNGPPKAGERFHSDDHARTLQQIAVDSGASFYRGDLAKQIAAASQAGGGRMTVDDLAAHEPEWVEPISIDYHGYRLHEIPPNGQGLAALLMLGILRHHPIRDLQVDCPDVVHVQIEAMKLAFADAHRYIADPKWMDVDVRALLDDDYLAGRARLIDPSRAQNFDHGTPLSGGTILLTAADERGMMVSFIQSNYTGFGSGKVVPGTGIAMQNRGGCFNLTPGHPNQANGGKRPFHTIIPGFVTRHGAPVMAFGVMGGAMQPQGHAQVLSRIVDFRQNPQAALDAPRWQVFDGMRVGVEPGFPDDVYDTLRAKGHDVETPPEHTVAYGGGQAIWRLKDGYLGASDLRRDGQAVGY